MLGEIEAFLSRTHERVSGQRVLASVLTITSDAEPHDLALLRTVFAREVSFDRGLIASQAGARLHPTRLPRRGPGWWRPSRAPAARCNVRCRSCRSRGSHAFRRRRASTSANAISARPRGR